MVTPQIFSSFTAAEERSSKEDLVGRNDMTSLIGLLGKWPLIRQIRERADGTGLEAMSEKILAMHARIDDARVARSVRSYCGTSTSRRKFCS
jgi:hypothetical protein